MADITQVIDVQINVQAAQIIEKNYSLLLFLDYYKYFTELYKKYSSLSEMQADGYRNTDGAYIAANAIFSQNPRVPYIYVGRRPTGNVTVKIVTVTANTQYYTKISGIQYSYTSGGTPTKETIAAGLVAAINGGTPPVTVLDHLDGTYTLSPIVVGEQYTLSMDTRQDISAWSYLNSIETDLDNIKNETNEWSALMMNHIPSQDQIVLDTSAWCETNSKLYGTVDNNTNAINEDKVTDTTSLIAKLSALGHRYTFCTYRSPLDFFEAGWLGNQLALPPGKSTWALKTIEGFTANNLTTTQSNNCRSKRGNTYEKIAGIDVTRDGAVFNTDFLYIDVVRDLDYLVNDIETEMFRLLTTAGKIPYTDAGIAMCQSKLRERLNNAIGMGILASDPIPTITVPLAKDIPVQDKQDRILKNLNFTATLAGAIQSIVIRGTVTF
jgi:hypothetical protein